MARRTKTIVIGPEGGRDEGRHYLITEMSAARAERWARRMFSAMVAAEVDIPDDIQSLGIAGLAVISLKAMAAIPNDEADALMNEMMMCVSYIPDPSHPAHNLRCPPLEDDIEEVMTRVTLRQEVLELHVGFSLAASQSTSELAAPIPLVRTS